MTFHVGCCLEVLVGMTIHLGMTFHIHFCRLASPRLGLHSGRWCPSLACCHPSTSVRPKMTGCNHMALTILTAGSTPLWRCQLVCRLVLRCRRGADRAQQVQLGKRPGGSTGCSGCGCFLCRRGRAAGGTTVRRVRLPRAGALASAPGRGGCSFLCSGAAAGAAVDGRRPLGGARGRVSGWAQAADRPRQFWQDVRSGCCRSKVRTWRRPGADRPDQWPCRRSAADTPQWACTG